MTVDETGVDETVVDELGINRAYRHTYITIMCFMCCPTKNQQSGIINYPLCMCVL